MTFAQCNKPTSLKKIILAFFLFATVGLAACGEKPSSAKAEATLPVPPTKEPTPEEKLARWQKEAADGKAEAQYQLGCVSYFGSGLSKDAEMSMNWGKVEPKDPAAALEWWQKASTQGHHSSELGVGAIYYLGKGVPKDITKGLEHFTRAADGGNPAAQAILSTFYWTGQDVTRDVRKAVALAQKAADQGSHYGQSLLAGFYQTGADGVIKNAEKAAELYQLAAVAGNEGAQNSLAQAYANGEGITKDPVLAYAWANVAAAAADIPLVRNMFISTRNQYEARLTPEQVSEGQRIAAGWKKGERLVREVGAASSVAGGVPVKRGIATAFIVSKSGHALTNHHVIEGCKDVKLAGQEKGVKVITSDVANDIALLQVQSGPEEVASFSSDPSKLRQGEDIVVFGYPLSFALSSGGNLTPGTVSALSGLGNNSNQIQITAPIQPGSSGSPVIDRQGNVVGLVSMKLSDAKAAKATGSIPQNVNFAVSGQTVKAFLDQNKISYSTGGGFLSREKSNADIAEMARKFTAIIECWR